MSDSVTDLETLGFETPALHNRVRRMRHSGPQSLNVVFGLFGLIAAAIGVIAVLVTLITIQPSPDHHGVDRFGSRVAIGFPPR